MSECSLLAQVMTGRILMNGNSHEGAVTDGESRAVDVNTGLLDGAVNCS